nr:hypothetical protein Itr_chr03CG02690 [Ipomoea trifida]
MEMDEQPMGGVKTERPRDGDGPSAMEMVAEGVTAANQAEAAALWMRAAQAENGEKTRKPFLNCQYGSSRWAWGKLTKG